MARKKLLWGNFSDIEGEIKHSNHKYLFKLGFLTSMYFLGIDIYEICKMECNFFIEFFIT